MNLTDSDVRAAYHCVAACVRPLLKHGDPVPKPMRSLYARLEAEIRDMSRSRRDRIGAREAADILEMSKRQVHRIADKLGGEIVEGRWLFNRSAVEGYAEERRGQAASGY